MLRIGQELATVPARKPETAMPRGCRRLIREERSRISALRETGKLNGAVARQPERGPTTVSRGIRRNGGGGGYGYAVARGKAEGRRSAAPSVPGKMTPELSPLVKGRPRKARSGRNGMKRMLSNKRAVAAVDPAYTSQTRYIWGNNDKAFRRTQSDFTRVAGSINRQAIDIRPNYQMRRLEVVACKKFRESAVSSFGQRTPSDLRNGIRITSA